MIFENFGRRSGFFPLALLAAALGVRDSFGDPAVPRDVILITVDTLRWDATGFSGAGKVATPTLDRLAERGRVFSFAHAHAVVTLPSHASILTGLYPYQHGVRDNAGFTLRDDIPTLASMLRGSGYRTAAFVSAFTLDRRFGLATGFDVYDDECDGYSGRISTLAERPGEQTVARAKAWWDAHRGEPRLLWIHLFAPHFPYEPREPFASKYKAAPYYGEAALADEQLEPILGPILRQESAGAIVVFTSDHGESLGDHGELSHGIFAYEATLKVPLVVFAPGLVAPGEDRASARHVDIVPTILDLAGRTVSSPLPGRSLARPRSAEGGDDCYFEALTAFLNRGWAPLYGLIEGHGKAVDLPVAELYALDRDPGESVNEAAARPEALRSLVSKIPARAREASPREIPGPDVVEKLRSLGYVAAGSAPPPPARFDASTDPKNLIAIESRIDGAITRHRKGDVEGGVRALRAILKRHPRNAYVYSQLAYMLAEQGKHAEAVELLSKAVSLGIAGESMKATLALGLVQTGKARTAWELLSPRADSRDPETQVALGTIAAALGRAEEARARFERALALDPTYPSARVDLAVLHVKEGRFDDAKPLLERALAENPYLPDGWNALGAIRARQGDLEGALDAWERAVKINPRLPQALFNIAVAAEKIGETGRAISALERFIPLAQGEPRRRAEAMLQQLKSRRVSP